MTTKRELESDFGQPLGEIIAGFAGDGYTVKDAAATLDVPCQWLTKQARLCGLLYRFNTEPPEVKTVNRRPAKTFEPTYVTYNGITDTLAGHARRIGLAKQTVSARHRKRPDDLDFVFAPRKHRGYNQHTGRAKCTTTDKS